MKSDEQRHVAAVPCPAGSGAATWRYATGWKKRGDVLRHFDGNGTEFALVVLDDNV